MTNGLGNGHKLRLRVHPVYCLVICYVPPNLDTGKELQKQHGSFKESFFLHKYFFKEHVFSLVNFSCLFNYGNCFIKSSVTRLPETIRVTAKLHTQ